MLRTSALRFWHGAVSPIHLLRLVWADPRARSSFVHRTLPPLCCVVVLAAAGIRSMVGTLVETHGSSAALHALVGDGDDDHDTGRSRGRAAGREEASAALGAPLSAPRLALRFLQSKLANLIAMLGVLEWVLVWIGREHHEVLASEAASLAGLPADPPPTPPRLRFDPHWMLVKGWRAIRFLLFLALGSPAAWCVSMLPAVGVGASIAVEALWTAYWAGVFAIANSSLAWSEPPRGAAPSFIRGLRRAGRVPVVGWIPRLYARVLELATRQVWPACLAFESAPLESAGLALTRSVASLPGIYIVTRPFFTPAATGALLASRPCPRPGPGPRQ